MIPMVSWAKKKDKIEQTPCHYSRYIHHKFFIFAQDTMEISSPNFFLGEFDFVIFVITTNFGVYRVRSTHVPKIHVRHVFS
jgi:hypothetical protein